MSFERQKRHFSRPLTTPARLSQKPSFLRDATIFVGALSCLSANWIVSMSGQTLLERGAMWNKRLQTALLAAIATLRTLAKSHKRKNGLEAPSVISLSKEKYEIRPFLTDGDLFTFAEFQELLKKYNCGSDNGTGYWASHDGIWFDRKLGEPMGVYPEEVRLGKRPEVFFTHVMYHGK
jgi:hypothetical protein